MKTQTIIVLARTQPDRKGRPVTLYHDGEIRPQSFGPATVSPQPITGAKVYETEAEATRALLAEPDLLRDFSVAKVDLWLPQVGETVVYMARSNISGSIANVRLGTVKKVTRVGYVHLDRITEAFGRYGEREFSQRARSNFFTTIRPASEDDLATLPKFNDMAAAQRIGREMSAAERAAAKDKAIG